MARYVDKSFWEEEVLIPDTNTPVLGGQPLWEGDRLVDGFYNVPIAILADRTRLLKNRIEGVENEVIEGLKGFLVADENLADLEDIGQAKYNLGLNLVDNTPDINKPISIPTQTALDQKVDKESGKGLSQNDFTDAYKEKLDGIAPEATKNATDAQLRDRATHTGEQPISSVTGLQAALNSKVDVVPGKGLSSEDFTAADKMKLNGIEEGATANQTDSYLLNRVNHTGVQAISTVSGLQAALDAKVDKVAGKQLSTEDFTTVEKTKLSGIESGATANQTDAFLVNRANHTGTQAISTVSGLQSALDSKVDKVAGMGLSQENFTTAEKNKLASLESSRFKGEFVSLSALEAAFPTTEVGSFAYVDQGVGEDVVKYIWDSSDQRWVLQQGESATLTPSDVKSLYESNPDTNAFTDSEKSKLAGIATQATKNASDSYLLNRANHTGTQAASTITGLATVATTGSYNDLSDKPTIPAGTVTSVGLSAPTGFSVSGSPVTGTGTLALTFAPGYSLPTTAKQGQWDAAYGWGNHASVGYALASSLAPIATTGSWADISDKPAVIASGATQQEARDSIGAGTSNLSIGTTASTAKAGNWQPSTATKTQVLNGTANAFVSGVSYHNVISWAAATHSSGTVTLDLDTSLNHNLSVGGNITMASPSNADAGKTGDIVITMTANGTVSWNTNWKFLGSVPDIGANGEMWVISYKVLNSSFIIAAASKVAS